MPARSSEVAGAMQQCMAWIDDHSRQNPAYRLTHQISMKSLGIRAIFSIKRGITGLTLPSGVICLKYGKIVRTSMPEPDVPANESVKEDESMNNSDSSRKTKLFYLGHASIRIDTAEGKVIYIDPSAGKDYSEPADLVLVTHNHGDHNALNMITKNDGCRVIVPSDALKKDAYQSFDVSGIIIKAVPAYNSNHKKTECVGYVLEFDGIKLYHAGDTSKIPEMADLEAEHLDYALLPMDNVYNMGPDEAAQCADLIRAKHYMPIHTGPNGVFSEENIAKFNPEGKLVVKPGETITFSVE